MGRKPLSQDIKRKVKDMYDDGYKQREIAYELDISAQSVFNIIARYKKSSECKRGQSLDKGKIKALWKSNSNGGAWSDEAIAKECNCTVEQVMEVLRNG